MMDVHHKGKGIAGVYPLDVAETKVNLVAEMSRINEFPLKLIVEPE